MCLFLSLFSFKVARKKKNVLSCCSALKKKCKNWTDTPQDLLCGTFTKRIEFLSLSLSHTHTHTHTLTHARTHAHSRTHTQEHARSFTHSHTHTLAHTHTRTHTSRRHDQQRGRQPSFTMRTPAVCRLCLGVSSNRLNSLFTAALTQLQSATRCCC